MKGSVRKNPLTGKWDFVVDIGKDPFTGKRKQKKKRGFNTKQEAEKALTKILNEMNEGTFFEPVKMTVNQYMDMWFKERKLSVERTTYQNNLSFFRVYISPQIGSFKMFEVTSFILQHFVNELVEQTNLTSSTIHKIFDVLKVSFAKAVKLKIIKENPVVLVDLPKIKKAEMKVWDIQQVKFFLENFSNIKRSSKYLSAYLLALFTGMRQGEILGLRWKDIDFPTKQILIRQTISHDGRELRNSTKTRAGMRTIHIPDVLINQLKTERKTYIENKLKYRNNFVDNDLVVSTKNGNPVKPTNLSKAFKIDVRKVGLPIIRFHDLRHTHATMLIQQNINPKVIQERLGHSRIGITLDIYSHVLPSMQQEVATKLDQIVSTFNI